MKMINTSECEKCKHGTVDDTNKARVKVHCDIKNKDYIYGACIPCEDKEKSLKRKLILNIRMVLVRKRKFPKVKNQLLALTG